MFSNLSKSDAIASPFRESRLKIEWAKSKIDDFNSLVDEFTKSDPIAVFRCPDPDRETHHVIQLQARHAVPPAVALQFSDICHNLRASLDYLACSLTRLNGSEPNRKTMFPFAGNKDSMETVANVKIGEVSPKARGMILALKPYKGGNDLLYSLNEMNRTDKHLRMISTINAFDWIGGQISVSEEFDMATKLIGTPDKGIPILSLPKEAEFNHELQISAGVAIDGIEPVKNQPIGAVAIQLCDLAERIIGIFDAESCG